MLVDGKWSNSWDPFQKSDAKGRFVRQTSTFRDWITPDGAPGPEGQRAFPAEAGRYHLYVAYICPWASRTLMARQLKGLSDVISVSVVDPRLGDNGWEFGDFPGSSGADDQIGARFLHQLYSISDPAVNGRATVPVLWDKARKTIVNNESADILRIMNSGFGDLANDVDLRPEDLVDQIDVLNDAIYEPFNNGVYKAGFAKSQEAHNEAVTTVFDTMDAMETRLSDGRDFLLGDRLTETDLRAFVTLIRFDAAYVGLFKTNRKRVEDYPFLQAYTKRVLDLPGIRSTVKIDHIKAGYYSIAALNPNGIVPNGPDLSALGL
ncbi:glutathione S-transferase [Actibacterium mucosum KCTC 23349]|uniref:Glutathione S-transferase n=1 Tax=Actibacterium mucosum KCTC 23349 TaxID=1454373 RepID=A0A037ZLN7_9RHOB|nr:glutathione S-transferase C-terminal domain-containing protein [Actibacterium mucosum]KAJ56427.1 glutathione S-transferase [Actibacterium mucosum KCTC 23349]